MSCGYTVDVAESGAGDLVPAISSPRDRSVPDEIGISAPVSAPVPVLLKELLSPGGHGEAERGTTSRTKTPLRCGAMAQINKIDGDARTVRALLGEKYGIDYYQREYRWRRRDVEAMLEDLETRFTANFSPGDSRQKVQQYA